jgi:phosphoribosyl 1,2-cyclic phosphodiesterase
MRFASLGSGSRGNATLIEAGTTCLMLDCGFSVTEIERRLARQGKRAEQITAVLVTHEHGDHIRGVAALARKFGMPVWMTGGTAQVHQAVAGDVLRVFNPHESFTVRDIQVDPFPVPHDAREPCQFVFSDGARRLGVLTDTGSLTEYIRRALDRCDALLLECNHDLQMLAAGSYPPALKARVGGRIGHLSNKQAARLLSGIDSGCLQHLVAAHLSEKNNSPELARAALADAMSCDADWIAVATQARGLDWREIF